MLSVILASANASAATLTLSTEDFPPFNHDEKGVATGPLAEIVGTVCRHMQTNCVIETLPWRRVMGEVNEGKLDGAFPLVRLPEREQIFYFIGPVVETSYAIYANSGNTFQYLDAKDLNGYTIGVYGPSGTSAIVKQITSNIASVKLEMELDNLTVLKKLSVGRYGSKGVGFLNRNVAQYLISEGHIANVRFAGVVQRQEYYIGLSRKSVPPDLAAKFGEAFAALNQSGELATIIRKYGLEPAPPNAR